jgi:hypothetical protein
VAQAAAWPGERRLFDAQDHVFIVNHRDITDKEAEIAKQAPPFLEFDAAGNLVRSFGDWEVVPNITHGCHDAILF